MAAYRHLSFGTALSLVFLMSSATAGLAQSQAGSPQAGSAELQVGDDVTVLPRLDVGAGAEGTAGASVIAVTREELERKQPTDLQEIFAGEPAVAVGGAIPSTQKLYVNGVDETNLAVTVDGSRQNNKVFHHNGTYLLDPALLKAVTVQPGVAPADAGPGAFAGSIGFETVDVDDLLLPGRDFGGFLSGTWDTNSGTFVTGVSGYGRSEGFEILGFVNVSQGGNFTAGNGEEMLGTGTDLISGLAKVAYETLGGHRFELSHEQVRDDELRPYRANVYINIRNEPVLRQYTLDRQNTVFTYTIDQPAGWWDPKVVLAYSRTQVETPVYSRGSGALLAPAIGATSSFNGKAENRFNLELGSVTAGLDFYGDRAELDYDDPSGPEFPEEKAANLGAYAQARLEPFDRTRLSFGGRLDNQWFTGTDGSEWHNAGVSGNVSGEYDLGPDFLTAKAGAARVWGGVPLAENFIQNPAWTYGDGPSPVTSISLTGGLEARFEGLTLEANVFMTDIRNARLPVYRDGPNRSYDLDSWGWEVGAGYDWGSGYVRAKYADIRGEVDGVAADSEVGRYLTTPLGEIIMLTAGWRHEPWGLTLGADAEFGLKSDATLVQHPSDPTSAKLPLPAYQVFNAFAEWTPPSHRNLTLRVEARNIFDETYTSRASYGQDFDGVKPHFEPGRTFRLNARVQF
jgi:hemoglobin/transferrin/lactoferrin receptor protein